MNRGVAREPTFFADADRVEFGRLLGVGHDRFGVEIHAYCLMPNHFHLVLHCPSGGLSDFMQQLSSVFTRHTNDRVGRDGPLFRGRFHSAEIDSAEYLLLAVRYVHRNPIALPGETPESYRWSSHRAYLGHRGVPGWLRVNEVLGMFGGDTSVFHEFVVGESPNAGSPNDAARLNAIVELAVAEFEVSLERARRGLSRIVGLLVLDQLAGDVRDRYAESFGFASRQSMRQAVWRARREASANPILAAVAARALEIAA